MVQMNKVIALAVIFTCLLAYARQETWDMLRSMQETHRSNMQQFQDASCSLMFHSMMESFAPQQQMINVLQAAVMQETQRRMAQKTIQMAQSVNRYHVENANAAGSGRVVQVGSFATLDPNQQTEAVMVAALCDMSRQNAQNILQEYARIFIVVAADRSKVPLLGQLSHACLCHPKADDDTRRLGVFLAMIICQLDGNGRLPLFVEAVEQKLQTTNSNIFKIGALYQVRQEMNKAMQKQKMNIPNQRNQPPIHNDGDTTLKFAFSFDLGPINNG